MNKNKFVIMLIVCAVSAVFFTVIFAQFKTVEETDVTGIRTARELQNMKKWFQIVKKIQN